MQLGGLPIPPSRARPKSVQPGPSSKQTTLQLSQNLEGQVSPVPFSAMQFPKERILRPNSKQASHQSQLLRLKCPSESTWLVTEWDPILHSLDRLLQFFPALESSQHSKTHAARLLDQFAPSTLLRYFSAWDGFFKTLTGLQLDFSSLTKGQLADALVTLSLSKKSECAAGCQITIKAIRWVAAHAGVDCLRVAWNPITESFLKSRIPKELKEWIPFSLYTLVPLERRMLMSSCPTAELVMIGAILICTLAVCRCTEMQLFFTLFRW